MFVPVPMWDIVLENVVTEKMVQKICAERGLVLTDGCVVRLSSTLMKAVLCKHMFGRTIQFVGLCTYIGSMYVTSALLAAWLTATIAFILHEHLKTNLDFNNLTEEEARRIFLKLLKNPGMYLAA